jgi:hypothetical protein
MYFDINKISRGGRVNEYVTTLVFIRNRQRLVRKNWRQRIIPLAIMLKLLAEIP